MELIDNYLPEKEFENLSNCILSPEFDWHYLSGILSHDTPSGSFQFIHLFYDPDTGSQSPYLPVLNYTLEKLGVQSLRRIKSNLTPKNPEPFKGGFHIDYPHMKTAILYMNSNNGYTEFKNGDRVDSIENRMVIFDSNLEHQTVTCTDEKIRIVINFNYSTLFLK